jgi:hypothetical protein
LVVSVSSLLPDPIFVDGLFAKRASVVILKPFSYTSVVENVLFVTGKRNYVFVLQEILEAYRAGFISSIFVDVESGVDKVSYEAIIRWSPVWSLSLTGRPDQHWNEDADKAGETAAL